MTNAARPRALLQSLVTLALVLLLGLLSATPALAQSHWLHNRLDLFAEGGGSFFTPGKITLSAATFPLPATNGNPPTSQSYVAKGSLLSSGRLFVGGGFWFTRHDAVQLSYSYTSTNPTDFVFFTPPLPPFPNPLIFSVAERAHFFSVDYLRAFPIGSHWNWFLAAGIGTVDYRTAYSGSLKFAANLGTGISYRLTRRWSLRAEYRDYIVRYPFENALMHNHAPTLGVVFHF
jgi:hypothetical protein